MLALTSSGVGVCCVAGIAIPAGLIARYPELTALGGLGALLLAVALVCVLGAEWPVVERLHGDLRAFVGEHLTSQVRVSPSRGSGWVSLWISDSIDGAWTRPCLVNSRRLRDRTVDVSHPLDGARRGVYHVAAVRTEMVDLMGLVRARRVRPAPFTLFVRPRPHPLGPIPDAAATEADGPHSAADPTGGVEFHGLRDYEFGDDIRSVHWLSSARCGRMVVRQSVPPAAARVLVLLDTNAASYDRDSFEHAVVAAASLVATAARAGMAIDLCPTFDGHAGVFARGLGEQEMLDLLAGIEMNEFDPGLHLVSGAVHSQSDSIVVALTGAAGQPLVSSAVRTVLVRFAADAPHGCAHAGNVAVFSVADSRRFAEAWSRMCW